MSGTFQSGEIGWALWKHGAEGVEGIGDIRAKVFGPESDVGETAITGATQEPTAPYEIPYDRVLEALNRGRTQLDV